MVNIYPRKSGAERKAKCLSVFLENWYDAKDLKTLANQHISKLKDRKLDYDSALVFSKALSQTKYISIGQRDTILELTERINQNKTKETLVHLPKKGREIFDEIRHCIIEENYKKGIEIANTIENEEDGLKFAILGILYEGNNNPKEAEKYYSLAIENGDNDALFNLANLYIKQEKHQEAEKYYLLAIEKEDDYAFFNLAFLYEEQEKYQEAEKYYLLTIEKGIDKALFNLAYLYDNQNDNKNAEKYYLLAIEKGVDEALNNLAILYDNQNKHQEAEKYYLLAIEKGDINAKNNLALLYYDQNINNKKVIELLIENNKNPRNLLIAEIWNGVFKDVEKRVVEMVKDNSDNLDDFLTDLLIHQQKNLVLKLFNNENFGLLLQEKYAVIYYVCQLINHPNEENLGLKIPPEIESTIVEVLDYIKEKEQFYGYIQS